MAEVTDESTKDKYLELSDVEWFVETSKHPIKLYLSKEQFDKFVKEIYGAPGL